MDKSENSDVKMPEGLHQIQYINDEHRICSKDRTLVIVDGVPITAKLENLASLDSIPEEAKIDIRCALKLIGGSEEKLDDYLFLYDAKIPSAGMGQVIGAALLVVSKSKVSSIAVAAYETRIALSEDERALFAAKLGIPVPQYLLDRAREKLGE